MSSNLTDRINGVMSSVAVKAPCLYTTTGNITLSSLAVQANGTWTSAMTAGNRVLVRNQTDSTENGIYDADTSTWTRAADFDGNRDVVQGTRVSVVNSPIGYNLMYAVTTANPIVIDSSNITFEDVSEDDVSLLTAIATGTLSALTLARHLANNLTITMFGAPTDGTSDCLAAFNAFHTAIPAEGAALIFPPSATNVWNFTAPLNIRKMVHIKGQVSQAGASALHGTQLKFAAGVSGLVFNSNITSLYDTVSADAALPGAYGSVLENVMVLGQGGATADGVVLRCQMECRKVTARAFSRYGFRIYADIGAGGSIEGDANQWILHNCKAILNGSHGLYVDGDDSNTGVCTKFFAQSNGGYGVYDNSLIGNLYLGVDTVGNTSGSVYCTRASSATTFIGTWEDDTGRFATLGANVTSIGGNGGNPTAASACFHMANGLAQNAPYQYINVDSTPDVGAQLGVNAASPAVFAFSTVAESASYDAWKWMYDNTYHVWHYQYAASTSFQPIAIPNSTGAIYTNRTFTGPIFQNGFAIKNAGEAYSASRVQMRGTAAPGSGTWIVGDIMWNDNVTAGGFVGWVCTTTGTPGTWKTFGAVTA